MKQLHTKQEVEEQVRSGKPTLFVWSTAWCPDCLYLNPFLPGLEAENPDLEFVKLDRDELLDLAIEQEILGIPSMVLTENGQTAGRFVSKERKTPKEIQDFINQTRGK